MAKWKKKVTRLPSTTKLIIDAYSNLSSVKRLVTNIYFYISKYKIIYSSPNNVQNPNELFLVSWEKLLRQDHQEQFRYLYRSCRNHKKNSANYFEIKRVLALNPFLILKNIINYSSSRSLLLKFQMDEVLRIVDSDQLSKVLVFCDTSPLQNFVCDFYNKKNIDTYSLQHGFYIEDNNRLFRVIYKSSNAKYFFVWDSRTLSFMKKYQGKKERVFIHSGPFSQSEDDFNSVIDDKKNESFSVGIYGCGKDQIEQNLFLAGLYSALKKNNEYEVTFISHPFFKLLDRLKFFAETRVFAGSNRLKKKNYDLSFVLNSSVWIELDERGNDYYILNSDFEEQTDVREILNKVLNEGVINNSPIRPFKTKAEALEIIKNTLCEERSR